jgi:hypothetical protein
LLAEGIEVLRLALRFKSAAVGVKLRCLLLMDPFGHRGIPTHHEALGIEPLPTLGYLKRTSPFLRFSSALSQDGECAAQRPLDKTSMLQAVDVE